MEETSFEPIIKGMTEDIVNQYLAFINADILKNSIYQTINSKYNEGLNDAEIKFNMNFIPDERTIAFVQRYSFENVKGLTDTLKDSLRKEVSQALMNRENVREIAARVKDVFKTTQARAEMIAKTESNRAYNMGHFAGAKDSGLKLIKEWNAQPERVSRAGNLVPCPICEGLSGQQVKMNEKFVANDGSEYLLPPVHPHCACRVLYIQVDD